MQVAWGELFLCYCTVNKLFYGARHLRLCYENPGVKLVRKPGVTASVGESRGDLLGHWGCHWEGAVVPAVRTELVLLLSD